MKTYSLKNALVAQVEPIEPWVAQDHLFRHAFGAEKALQGKSWDDEGFSDLGFSQEVRDATFAAVRKLYDEGRMCALGAVHEQLAGEERDGRGRRISACERCPGPLRDGCVAATSAPRTRYLGLFEELVAALAHDQAVTIGATEFALHSLTCLMKPKKLEGLVVGRLGLNTKRREPVFRIVRADGLQADLYYTSPVLTFRTLFRDVAGRTRGPLQALQKGVVPIPGEPLSERAVVSRPFWEGP